VPCSMLWVISGQAPGRSCLGPADLRPLPALDAGDERSDLIEERVAPLCRKFDRDEVGHGSGSAAGDEGFLRLVVRGIERIAVEDPDDPLFLVEILLATTSAMQPFSKTIRAMTESISRVMTDVPMALTLLGFDPRHRPRCPGHGS